MSLIKFLKCVLCGKEYLENEVVYTCPVCGEEGLLDVFYDYPRAASELNRKTLAENRDYSLFRYQPLLPIEKAAEYLPLQLGWTPLYPAQRLGKELGLKQLYLKDDGRNPSASFKDRASAMAVVRAGERGIDLITCASTGNAASSLACLSASVGMKNWIFVPEKAPEAKIAQLLIFGAQVVKVKGTYDQAFDLCLEATQKWGWYNRSTGINPYLLEGKKTCALELAEQFNWKVPDRVVVSVGDGCIIAGLWKGFYDLMQIGLIDKIPRLMGVQAAGSAPLAKAFWSGKPVEPIIPETLADSISVGQPRAAAQALRAVRESGGDFITVEDAQIVAAMKVLALNSGVFGEPAGVTGLAGLIKLTKEGRIDPEETVAVIITGNGLKDAKSALKAAGREPFLIEPDIKAVEKLMLGLKN